MKLKTLISMLVLLSNVLTFGQTQLKIYHGSGNVSQVFDASNISVMNPKIRLNEGDIFTVTIVNPNPSLYSYKLKTEELEIKSEDKAITDLLSVFNTILTARAGGAGFMAVQLQTNNYKDVLIQLTKDINEAKNYIIKSDIPESPAQALAFDSSAGFRNAILKIAGMSNAQYRFNNTSLLTDLNTLSDSAGADSFEKEAFKLLNSSLVDKIKEIKKQTDASVSTIWKKDFKVGEKPTKISIEIEKIDKSNASLIRDGNGSTPFVLDVAQIEPYFKRAVLELVPVANFVFAGNYNEFYLKNGIVQSRESTKTTVNPGVILNVNVARFGEAKEMSLGIGPGYKLNSAENNFDNLYFSALFSYKNFLRIGAGLGLSQVPKDELKDGIKVGDNLPANISNLDDLVQYAEKTSVFLTISFTGLNLTKKK